VTSKGTSSYQNLTNKASKSFKPFSLSANPREQKIIKLTEKGAQMSHICSLFEQDAVDQLVINFALSGVP
jgi:hypothetical protein